MSIHALAELGVEYWPSEERSSLLVALDPESRVSSLDLLLACRDNVCISRCICSSDEMIN